MSEKGTQLVLDRDITESISYVSRRTWREVKPQANLITERMYLKIIFARRSEVNVQGRVYLHKTVPLALPTSFKVKDLKKTKNYDALKQKFQAKTESHTTHKFNSYYALTDKGKILSFGLILEKEQNLMSLCSEYKRSETDPAYALRMKNALMGILVLFILILMAKDLGIVDMDILDMEFWWIYALAFGILWGIHRESIEAKCWYLAALKLTEYRQPFQLENKTRLDRILQLPSSKERMTHIDMETNLLIPWYSQEIQPQQILDLQLEKLEQDVFQVAMSVTSDSLAKAATTKERNDLLRSENAVLRSTIAELKQQNRLSLEIGKSLASETFEIVLTEESNSQRNSNNGSFGRRNMGDIDITKIFLAVILVGGGLAIAFLGMNFFIAVEMDLGSKIILGLGMLVAALFLFLLIFKARS